MAKQQPAALVFAGPVSRGTLTQLPGLKQHLHWIKSSSVPTASRAVYALRCGTPVRDYADLSEAGIIIVSAPEDGLELMITSLVSADLSWKGRVVVLYDSDRTSSSLEPLRELGAEPATLNYHSRPEQFVAEGTPEALRSIRLLTATKPLIALRSKQRYFGAMQKLQEEFYPLFASALGELREAGLDKVVAEKTASLTVAESARSYLRAGHRLLAKRAKPST